MPTITQTENQEKLVTEHHIKLTSAEIASLWTGYMNDSMSICTIGSFLSHVEDKETQSVLDFAFQVSQTHIQKLKAFCDEEQLPVPDGFSPDADVYREAPRLYTDDFYLFYIQNMGKIGMEISTLSLSNSSRLDICEYYTECLNEMAKLYNKASEIMLKKGTFIRAPYIPESKMVKFVQKQSYLAGWFGHRRPINVVEMTSIYFNMIQNQLGRTLAIGFSQVAKSSKVRDYMVRGRNIADKHVEIFGSVLSKEYLPSASAWSTVPTDSTSAPFSDKLMMFHIISLNAVTIGHYGMGVGTSFRHDLAANYVRLAAEVAQYAEDGANLMIENGWLEQPPQAADRDQLANGQK
jgi:hypothetical protein